MAGNSVFELVTQQGWQAGLQNLLRAEFRRWWKTKTWWVQSLIWISIVDFVLFTVVFAAKSSSEMAMQLSELAVLYGVFGGMFATVGIVVTMQGAIVGEKLSGTAAWVLSKPTSRHSFVLSKMIANGLGVAVTGVLVPGIVAYLILTIGTGSSLPVGDFLFGVSLLVLFSLYWLTFTVMLGTFFNSRGPVIGIPLALVLGQQFVLGILMSISPRLVEFLPFSIVMPPQDGLANSIVGDVIIGLQPTTWMPAISSIIAIGIFIFISIWRFRKEEF
ncbi:ABC transporter permease [Chloroflexota bacterium]